MKTAISQPTETAANDDLIQGYIARIDRASLPKPGKRSSPLRKHASDLEQSSWESASSPTSSKSADENVSEATAVTAASTTESAAAPEPTPPVALPKIIAVSARAGSEAPQAAGPTDDTAAGVNTPLHARGGPQSLREFLEQHPIQTNNPSFREQLDTRLLWIASGDYERARQPLTLVTAEQDTVARGLIESCIALRETHMGDLQEAANRAGQQIDRFRDDLRKLGDLGLANVTICRSVRGYGQYDPIEPARFPAGVGSEFVLYCEVRDFVSQKLEDGQYETRFDLTTLILSRAGETLLEVHDPNIVDRARNRRHDCFIPRLIRLPATLAPGNYVAKLSLIDKLGKKVAESRAAFQIVAGE